MSFHWKLFVNDVFTAILTFRDKKTGVVHSFEGKTAAMYVDGEAKTATVVGDGTGGQLTVDVSTTNLTSSEGTLDVEFVELVGSNPRTVLKGKAHINASSK